MPASFGVGDRVRLKSQPPYFKTAEPLPMLRPADLIPIGTEGTVIEQRPGSYWAVKFERVALLVDTTHLEPAVAPSPPETSP